MGDWVKHVKAYQAAHGGTYGDAMKAARASWQGKKKARVLKGTGVIDSIKRGIAKVKDALFFPPNKLPGDAQKAFDRLKDATITKIMVNRAPINSGVDKALNMISLGKYDKAKKELGYDKMFHLSMVLYTNKGKIAVQKLERISIRPGGSGGGESIDLPYTTGDTLASFMEKARRKMGDHAFFQYNAFENNCQDFILGCLQANGALSAAARTFIKQDADALIKKLPGYVGRIAQAATDLGGKVRQALTGQGRRRVLRKKK